MTLTEDTILTKLKELDDKIDLLNRNQTKIRPHVAEHIHRILQRLSTEEEIKNCCREVNDIPDLHAVAKLIGRWKYRKLLAEILRDSK